MRNLKLTIEYDGTHFNGWQIQSGKSRTVQGEITDALNKILKEKISLIGSGRTDTGVHALGQVANVRINSKKPTAILLKALNANLPKDVVIHNIKEVNEEFHAQHSALTKTYRYSILHRETRSSVNRHYSYFFPHELNISLMKRESKSLIGTHDFKSFQASDPAKKKTRKLHSTIRTIKRVKINEFNGIICIDIEGNGFLYKMVRNIIGTLLDISHRNLAKGTLQSVLLKKDRQYAAKTAPACGLTLLGVKYPKKLLQ